MAFEGQQFCGSCGARLVAGAAFCGNCGAPIEAPAASHSAFQTEFLNEAAARANAVLASAPENAPTSAADEVAERGIIYTDTAKVAQLMGAAQGEVERIIEQHIASSRVRGVEYSLCAAASSGFVKDHIEKIKEAAKAQNARFVFIIGNWEVVPQMIWDNPADDGDAEVPSDLPYSVLSDKDPSSGVKYDFETVLRVGRLPVYQGESLASFRTYFENVAQHSGKLSAPVTFGETARQWLLTSKAVYRPFQNGGLVCSPEATRENVCGAIPQQTNLLFFNVHGSDQAKYWYGQEGGRYPEAFSPDNMRSLSTPNFVGVEACYGARFNGFSSGESVVEAALESKCLGLFGSSKIAFGVPGSDETSVCCADIIVGEFLNNIKCGMMSGDAAAAARKVFWEQAENDADIKTMMEFDLYGDPTARMFALAASKSAFVAASRKKGVAAQKSFVPALNIAMPDISRAINTSLARVNERINEQVNRYVWGNFAEVRDVQPKTYSVRCGFKSMYKNVYIAKGEGASGINLSIITYYDPAGKILRVAGTK